MRLTAVICLAATVTVTVAGCTATGPGQRPPGPLPSSAQPAYNLSGYSPAFKDGYIDGCETAKKTAYGLKDERRFSAEAQYRLGWNDGFSLCSRKR